MIVIREDGLDHPDVQALIALHRSESLASTPRENAHVLGDEGLRAAGVRFFTAWDGDMLLGMAALRDLGAGHVEGKSMRTHARGLRRGVARALLAHLVAIARAEGRTRVSLETGTHPMFDAANRLYEAAGFTDCPAFGEYPPSPYNRFMTLALT